MKRFLKILKKFIEARSDQNQNKDPKDRALPLAPPSNSSLLSKIDSLKPYFVVGVVLEHTATADHHLLRPRCSVLLVAQHCRRLNSLPLHGVRAQYP